MKITIKGVDYDLNRSLKAVMAFENLLEKKFELVSATDNLVFFYLVLKTNNADMSMEFDEFLNAVEDDSSLLPKYYSFLAAGKTQPKDFDSSEKSAE